MAPTECMKSPPPPFYPKFFPFPAHYPRFPVSSPLPGAEPPSSGLCSMCSVKNAPLYVCLIELAFTASVLALYIQHYMAQDVQTVMLTVSFTFALLSGIVAVCIIVSLAVGLCLESSTLLIPHMIGQIVGICIMTIIGALILLFTFTGVEYPSSLGKGFGTICLAIAVLCLAMALAEVWFFFLIRDAYIHLKRKEDEKREAEIILTPPAPEMLAESNNSVPDDPKGAESPEEPADPATVQRWWSEYFEAQRKQKKMYGNILPPVAELSCGIPAPPSETENNNGDPETSEGVVIEPVIENEDTTKY